MSEFDGTLHQPLVEVVLDQPTSEVNQRPLGEYGILRPHAVKHQLPTSIKDGLLDGRSIALSLVSLQQSDHREQRRWLWRRPARHVRVHRGKLALKRVSEQFAKSRIGDSESGALG